MENATLTEISMLYHTARLILYLPLLEGTNRETLYPSQGECFAVCESSLDIIVSILRRLNSQHNPQNMSLFSVYGCIVAADTSLALFNLHASQRSDTQSRFYGNLSSLNATLTRLSPVWKLASDAKVGLDNAIRKIEHEREVPKEVPLSETTNSNSGIKSFTTIAPLPGPLTERCPSDESMVQNSENDSEEELLDLCSQDQKYWAFFDAVIDQHRD